MAYVPQDICKEKKMELKDDNTAVDENKPTQSDDVTPNCLNTDETFEKRTTA